MSTVLTQIPIIDFESFINGNQAMRREVANQVRQACQETGFLYIRNHGVSETLIKQAFNQSRQFFALPIGIKQQLAWTGEADYLSKIGYIGIEQEGLDQTKPGDLKEALSLSKEGLETTDLSILLTGFPETMSAFHHACVDAANWILRAIAIALELPELFFVEKHTLESQGLFLFHYPPLEQEPKPGQLRAGEHTDFGTLSLVFQDDVGGLEVLTKSGQWMSIPPISGTIVVNIADLLQRWTNDLFTSSKHRVVNPLGLARQKARDSIVFFCDPSSEIEISCLETCQTPAHPSIYPPILAGDYIKGLLGSVIDSTSSTKV